MMNAQIKKRNGNGFSLIELIIAIAILVILTGVLAPQFLKYIERSRRAVCLSDMDALIKEYQLAELTERPKTAEEAQILFENIITAEGGKRETGTDGFYTAGSFSGFCKSGGTYNCIFTENLMYLTIDCSEHGENALDIETLKDRIEKLDLSDLGNYTTLAGYLETHPVLNSEATGTADYGGYGSLARAISAKLSQQGIVTAGRSWRIYKQNGQYNMFLTERTITKEDIGSDAGIKCTKYDIVNNKIIYGQVTVIKDAAGDYPVINGSSFTEIK